MPDQTPTVYLENLIDFETHEVISEQADDVYLLAVQGVHIVGNAEQMRGLAYLILEEFKED